MFFDFLKNIPRWEAKKERNHQKPKKLGDRKKCFLHHDTPFCGLPAVADLRGHWLERKGKERKGGEKRLIKAINH